LISVATTRCTGHTPPQLVETSRSRWVSGQTFHRIEHRLMTGRISAPVVMAPSLAPYSCLVRIALINSGLGLLAAAAVLHRIRPDADLMLATDPDGMPWGPRTPEDIIGRAMLCARATQAYQPDVIVMACNTGSVHALDAMRAEFEPDIPVIGTVPAIRPAAGAHQNVAIWATVATTASAYQRRLIVEFGGSAVVTPVACPGLADAVDAGDEAATAAAVADAAGRTPAGCEAVVLGCTEYELAASQIAAAVPGAVTFGSASAVAAQALRRVPASPAASDGAQPGSVRVLLSGRLSPMPAAALRYLEGRLLAPLVDAGELEREPAPTTAVTR
jgi:glutamate racemase